MTDAQQNLLVEAPCGIFSFTEDGIITAANKYCCSLLEYSLTELAGKNISAVLTLSSKIFYQTHLYPLLKLDKYANEIFITLLTKPKEDIPVLLNVVLRGSTDVKEIICSFIPVSNRRKYEDEILQAKKNAEEALYKNEVLEKVKQELEQHQKSLDKQVSLLKFQNKELLQLSDVITHDLQEPVRKLMLFSNQLQDEKFFATSKEYALSAINRSAQRIKFLLQQLQKYLSLTQPVAINEAVDLKEVVKHELALLQKSYPEVFLRLQLDPLPVITGNKNQLSMLFHQLMKNAFLHGTRNDTLDLSISAVIIKENLFNFIEDKYKYVDYVKIIVADKGEGFDGKYNDYVLDVLKRLKISDEHLGFGLAFCKRIAENHFGNIKAQGQEGKGVEFTIMLPIDNVL